jgi:hypothetical protein
LSRYLGGSFGVESVVENLLQQLTAIGYFIFYTNAPHIPESAISEVGIHNVACQLGVEVNGVFVVLHEVAPDGPIIQN